MAETLTTSGAVQLAAGLNARSLTGAQYTDIIMQNEGRLVMETRRNWVSGLSSLSSPMQQAVKSIVTAWSAIDVINYDQSVFTSGSEARAMINSLYDKSERALEILRDFDSNEIKDIDGEDQ